MALQRRLRLVAPPDGAPDGADLRLAFASSDLERVDRHFGDTPALVIHRLDPDGPRRVVVAQFTPMPSHGETETDRLSPRIRALEGCAAVYCEAAGVSAVQQLLAVGVQPVKVPPGSPIRELLLELQACLRAGRPPAWMRRAALRRKESPQGFEALADLPWDGE
ncbi:nitrogen fixation protein NifX [Ectothiorhodospira mobilis]|uniref:Nitrogen fixation protein NifX n=1 Tax=Ectothiorhodospira mobilis TaxID=195064 RepID=A0A1I4QEM0_ECTMO|nr:NifB/NifX family molybdenum-iron cluster-binding protein [Ectothiorhodospira mobilis]SFM38508.1 nitrogen fixation protein NifX [Ectothiorhodospira mobilis]